MLSIGFLVLCSDSLSPLLDSDVEGLVLSFFEFWFSADSQSPLSDSDVQGLVLSFFSVKFWFCAVSPSPLSDSEASVHTEQSLLKATQRFEPFFRGARGQKRCTGGSSLRRISSSLRRSSSR